MGSPVKPAWTPTPLGCLPEEPLGAGISNHLLHVAAYLVFT
jgi:hypothetical protein